MKSGPRDYLAQILPACPRKDYAHISSIWGLFSTERRIGANEVFVKP
jgi:hypothetical protein